MAIWVIYNIFEMVAINYSDSWYSFHQVPGKNKTGVRCVINSYESLNESDNSVLIYILPEKDDQV